MRIRPLLVVLASVLALGAPAQAQIDVREPARGYVPGEAIVRFEPGVGAAERRDVRAGAGVGFDETLRLPRAQVVTFDGSVRAAVERLEHEPGVAYAQPNYRYRALADTHFGELWGLAALPGVDAVPAWSRTRGAGQVIAILDTGVDLTHPDLQANLWTGPGGIHGHDFVGGDSNPDDLQYHGTHVAGTAAAVADNNLGVAGVAPEADIMAVRVLDGDGEGSTAGIADGILFASQNGAGVINLSLGGPTGPDADPATTDAARIAEQRGSTIVAAAGNAADDNDLQPFSPCSVPAANIVCVAAVDDQRELASYSNYGRTSVDVGAPGGDVEGAEREILSAKPAWLTRFDEDFDAIAGEWTQAGAGVAWDLESGPGNSFASDSPGVQYANNSSSQIAAAPVDLAGGRDCRLRFDYLVDTAGPGDFLSAGVQTGSGVLTAEFAGNDQDTVEVSLPEIDGQTVTPTLRFTSDATGVDQGAFVDDFRIACRGGAAGDYDDEIVDASLFDLSAGDGGGSYMAISGTSMATPHVAGVAALVRAVDPGAPPAQVVQAIKESVTPLPSLTGLTATGGAVNASRAMDRALALPNPAPPAPPAPPSPAAPTAPGKARIARVTVNRRGVVTMVVRGDAGTRGSATLTADLPRRRAARVVRVARKAFRIGSTRRATVRLKLSRPALRQLRRKRRLRLGTRIVLTNAAGLSSTARGAIGLRMRRSQQP